MAQIYLKIPALTEQDIIRFWSFVERREPNDCWPWVRGADWDGYGFFALNVNGKKVSYRAHRIAYFLHYNEDPWPLLVRHLTCDNPPCCNGAHLATGTLADNRQDCVNKNRQARGERHNFALYPELIKRGEDSAFSKLTEPEILVMRRLYAQGWRSSHIAELFPHVDKTNVHHILKRKTWTHI
jgi:hypothetical protein